MQQLARVAASIAVIVSALVIGHQLEDAVTPQPINGCGGQSPYANETCQTNR